MIKKITCQINSSPLSAYPGQHLIPVVNELLIESKQVPTKEKNVNKDLQIGPPMDWH